MGDDSEKPESGTGEEKPPKIKAEDNPWYLLATLYGVPDEENHEIRNKNRIAWNRYFAGNLDGETRTKLVEEDHRPADESMPYSLGELQDVGRTFGARCKTSAKKVALPTSDAPAIFSNIEFEQYVFFDGYLFKDASFQNAVFCKWAFFHGATFSEGTTFDGATFSQGAVFDGAIFSGGAHFQGATFSRGAYFQGATFAKGAIFHGATFAEGAFFSDATLAGGALFGSVTFHGWAKFGEADFSGRATFDGATFCEGADFGGATFAKGAHVNGGTYFCGAAFSEEAHFQGATFSDEALFADATFSRRANFGKASFGGTSSFVNAEMNGETSFEGAIFKAEPPKFFGAKLHQGTVWRGINWPKPKDKEKAGAFIDAYACLKLEMDRLKKHEDELDFFSLELQSRRVLLGIWTGLPIAIYGIFSDYGRSYLRPLVALFYLALIGTLAFLSSDSLSPWQSLGLSAANALNVFGFRKDFFEPAVIARLPAWLDVVSALQTIFGTILLFLVGLGTRNEFRMK